MLILLADPVVLVVDYSVVGDQPVAHGSLVKADGRFLFERSPLPRRSGVWKSQLLGRSLHNGSTLVD